MEEDWFTVDEVASRVRVSTQTVRRWLRDGALVGRNYGGRTGYRISGQEVDRFLRQGPVRAEKTAA